MGGESFPTICIFRRCDNLGDRLTRSLQILWTNHYSNQFILFVALAILQSHRDVLLRYLTEFDEVLKYANDLSGTVRFCSTMATVFLLTNDQIDLDTTLAQAEVLFLSFRNMVEDLDRDNAAEAEEGGAIEGLRKRRGSGTLPDDLRDLLISWRPEASM